MADLEAPPAIQLACDQLVDATGFVRRDVEHAHVAVRQFLRQRLREPRPQSAERLHERIVAVSHQPVLPGEREIEQPRRRFLLHPVAVARLQQRDRAAQRRFPLIARVERKRRLDAEIDDPVERARLCNERVRGRRRIDAVGRVEHRRLRAGARKRRHHALDRAAEAVDDRDPLAAQFGRRPFGQRFDLDRPPREAVGRCVVHVDAGVTPCFGCRRVALQKRQHVGRQRRPDGRPGRGRRRHACRPLAAGRRGRRTRERTRRAERSRHARIASCRRGARALARSRPGDQLNAVARAQRNRRARVERTPRHRAQIDVLRDHRDQHADLQQRGLIADALAHPAAERKVRVLVPRRRVRSEVLRIECVRVGPQRRMTMRDVRRHEYRRTGRHVITADLVVVDQVAREAPDRRIEPQDLVDGLHQIRQACDVVGRGRATAEHRIELLAQPAQHVRMLRERIEPPRHPAAGRFVPGQEHRHHLVVHLALGQRRARVGVVRGEQQRDHVARLAASRAMLGDDRLDDRVDRAARARDPAVERRRHPARHEIVHVALRHHRLDAEAHRRPDLVRMPRDVRVEQHQPEHAQAHAHHLLDRVERRMRGPLHPALDERERRVADGRRMRFHLLAVKKRLHDPPVTPPELAVRRQQSVAEEHLEVVVEAAAHVVAVIVLQHVLDAVRMRERMREERAQPVAGDVAVLLLQLQQHRDGIALVFREVAHHDAAARAGRETLRAHADTCSEAACAASRASISPRVANVPVTRCT
ncbi:hypothetical protein FEQ05_01690 [Burkholderia pseudomultivorans]|uniref:Uncharacterized protein n=1 Tax=Burkholderia pseudomultivorans TaxID=1207504 RepID=A0ABU2E3R2_9BURK|nr:hypothetical protein [Burkholderia pseudomultivorans]MDR8817987.1 hypothetical protein [Burkholderia pseudomultivorans]MDR8830411.1 hypothetical protein [Burkholderia pseudomultivorans]